MPNFRLPLSGDVLQNINPWNWILKAGQVGLININLGRSVDLCMANSKLSPKFSTLDRLVLAGCLPYSTF